MLDRLAEIMDLPALRAAQASALEQGRYLGISLVPYIEPAGATFPGSLCQNLEAVTMRIAADGSVHVMTGMQSIGQGIETSYAQVAADILGARLSDVTISWGDTTATPWGAGTYSSRGAMFAVGAPTAPGLRLAVGDRKEQRDDRTRLRGGLHAHATLRALDQRADADEPEPRPPSRMPPGPPSKAPRRRGPQSMTDRPGLRCKWYRL